MAARALSIMADDSREFVTAQSVRLELLPKPRHERRTMEVRFYESHFSEAVAFEPLSEALGRLAEDQASKYGLSGADALHIAAAIRLGAGEFYTAEKPEKPLFRVKDVKVISLFTLQ